MDDLTQRLPGHFAGGRGRCDDERSGDDGGSDSQDQERRPGVEAIRHGARENGTHREAEPGDGGRRGQCPRAPLLGQRVREPRSPRSPQRSEREPERTAREQKRPELVREPLAERREREESRGGDGHSARTDAIRELTERQRDDERRQARRGEDHPRLDAREPELLRECRRQRHHRDPDERLEEDEPVDRSDGATHRRFAVSSIAPWSCPSSPRTSASSRSRSAGSSRRRSIPSRTGSRNGARSTPARWTSYAARREPRASAS